MSGLADWRHSIECGWSPMSYWRYCQKVSPCPTRRRPCTPCATVAATRSAATSSGGSVAASCSARCRSGRGVVIGGGDSPRQSLVRRGAGGDEVVEGSDGGPRQEGRRCREKECTSG